MGVTIDEARYARQILVPEIGSAGQRALCRTPLGEVRGDESAAETGLLYLERAGLVKASDEASSIEVPPLRLQFPNPQELEQLAGHPVLRETAAFLAGVLEAVETLKTALAIGPERSGMTESPTIEPPTIESKCTTLLSSAGPLWCGGEKTNVGENEDRE